MSTRADVVIPVYRGFEVTRECVESVLAHSGAALGQLIVVNDASPEPEIPQWLRKLALVDGRIVVLENERNLGFVASANRGLSLRGRDVVLLNSDTRVTAGWLDELLAVLHSDDTIAAAVPISNNATFCSVPDPTQGSPAELLGDAKLDLSALEPRSTPLPTAVGFCVAFKDRALNRVGAFDPAFGRGYNEENDWSMRAQRLGWTIVRANRALVYHVGSVSFGTERAPLDRKNTQELLLRYPHYIHINAEYAASPGAGTAARYVRRRVQSFPICVDMTHLQNAPNTLAWAEALALLRCIARVDRAEVTVRVRTDAQSRWARSAGFSVQSASAGLEPFILYHRLAPLSSRQDLLFFLNAPCSTVLGPFDLSAVRSQLAFERSVTVRALTQTATLGVQAVLVATEFHQRAWTSAFHVDFGCTHIVHPAALPRADVGTSAAWIRERVAGRYVLCAEADEDRQDLGLLASSYALWRGREGQVPALVLASSKPRGRTRAVWPPGIVDLGVVDAQRLLDLAAEAALLVDLSPDVSSATMIATASHTGVPAIGFRHGALPELAGDGALYLSQESIEELASTFSSVFRDERAHATLAAAAARRAACFAPEAVTAALTSAYAAAVDRATAGSLGTRRALWHAFGAA